MATFLFWNMAKKPLRESLFRLAMRHRVDVLLLSENGSSPGQTLEVLNQDQALYHFPTTHSPESAKIQIFTRYPSAFVRHRDTHSGFRWTMRRLILPGLPEILIVGVHLNSKRVYTGPSQDSECRDLAEHIRRIEKANGHSRTLVVGDFNVNPYEAGMLDAKSLNAEPTRALIRHRSRVVSQQSYPLFYNPMWNFFGDESRGPAGTFFFQSSQPVRSAWNILDQVLLRKELLPFFRFEDLEILTGDGTASFLTPEGRPKGNRENEWSDHLPIVFKLSL